MGANGVNGIPDDRQVLLSTLVIIISSTAAAMTLVHRSIAKIKLDKKLRPFGPDVRFPPHVRSFVPLLGSALEMGRGIRKFIAKYSGRFRQPIFTAKIGGDHCLFVGDPEHCTLVYAYSKYLDNFALQKQFTRNVLGIEEKDQAYIFPHDGSGIENGTFIAKEAHKQYRHYLFTNGELNKTIGAAQELLQELLPRLLVFNTNHGGQCQKIHLFKFVQECIFKASAAPLLSRHIATDEAIQLFATFDKGIPLMFGGAPSFLTKDARDSRDALVRSISEAKFIEEGSDLMKARKTMDLNDNLFTRTGLGLLFAALGNSIPSVFWCLCHIIADQNAYELVRSEVEGVVEARRKDDMNSGESSRDGVESFTLEELDRMFLLESSFTEALRLYHGAFTTREATQDFVFDPKTGGQGRYLIEKGTRIMSFMATRHHDPEVFDNVDSYQFDRFAPIGSGSNALPAIHRKNGKEIVGPVRAFGGGAHLCPGRKFISYEVRAFVAILVTKYDMKLAKRDLPGIDFASQGVGISHPDADPEIEVKLRE